MAGKSKKGRPRIKFRGKRCYFFLNPYEDMAFTRCPKCETKTKVRKYCLVIHIEPLQLLTLNTTCRFCPYCELIIVKQAELESLLASIFEARAPELIGNDYLVLGTMDRKDWKEAQTREVSPQEALGRTYRFKDVWHFKVIPAGWYPADR